MKEVARVYRCIDHEDVLEACKRQDLPIEKYGKKRNKYPYFIGKRTDKDGLKWNVSTPNSKAFKSEDWFKDVEEIICLDIYEVLKMDKEK